MSRASLVLCAALIICAEAFSLWLDGNMLLSRFRGGGFATPADLLCFRDNALLIIHPTPALAAAAARLAAYMYPPPFLLLNVPMALLSPFWEYCAWSALSAGLLVLAGRCAGLAWRTIALGLVLPASLYNLAIAETGAIVSALLVLSLTLAESSPILAGIAAGCLIIKPQFALVLPVCFLASRNWRAIIAAAVTVLALCALTTAVFSPAIWPAFFAQKLALSGQVLAAPWPQPVQAVMASVFFTARSLGAGLHLAAFVQFLATAAALSACWALWRRPGLTTLHRTTLTLCLAALATPYVLLYDLSALGMVLAGCMAATKWRQLPLFAAFWIGTGFYILLSVFFSTGGVMLAAMAVFLWPREVSSSFCEQKEPKKL